MKHQAAGALPRVPTPRRDETEVKDHVTVNLVTRLKTDNKESKFVVPDHQHEKKLRTKNSGECVQELQKLSEWSIA